MCFLNFMSCMNIFINKLVLMKLSIWISVVAGVTTIAFFADRIAESDAGVQGLKDFLRSLHR